MRNDGQEIVCRELNDQLKMLLGRCCWAAASLGPDCAAFQQCHCAHLCSVSVLWWASHQHRFLLRLIIIKEHTTAVCRFVMILVLIYVNFITFLRPLQPPHLLHHKTKSCGLKVIACGDLLQCKSNQLQLTLVLCFVLLFYSFLSLSLFFIIYYLLLLLRFYCAN